MYFEMERASKLDAVLSGEIDDYDAGVLTGERFEGGGVVVVGASSSGKSFEIDHSLKRLMGDGSILECGREKRFHQITLDGETTWKALGLQLAKELDYPMSSKLTEHEIWARVRMIMERMGIWLLHIDECQHMFQSTGERETLKIVNSLKTFMKHRTWPVVLVLSGIPVLLEKVNLDPQFLTLLTPFSMTPIDPFSDDLTEVETAIYHYADAIGVSIDEVRNPDVLVRLCHGHQNQFGRTFRFVIKALAALPLDATELTVDHLAERYALKTGCMPGNNVFIREDYRDCEVAVLEADVD
jgi:hypothetical protein